MRFLGLMCVDDDIKFGAIQNLALFLKVFHIDKREHMIDIFLNLQVREILKLGY